MRRALHADMDFIWSLVFDTLIYQILAQYLHFEGANWCKSNEFRLSVPLLVLLSIDFSSHLSLILLRLGFTLTIILDVDNPIILKRCKMAPCIENCVGMSEVITIEYISWN